MHEVKPSLLIIIVALFANLGNIFINQTSSLDSKKRLSLLASYLQETRRRTFIQRNWQYSKTWYYREYIDGKKMLKNLSTTEKSPGLYLLHLAEDEHTIQSRKTTLSGRRFVDDVNFNPLNAVRFDSLQTFLPKLVLLPPLNLCPSLFGNFVCWSQLSVITASCNKSPGL